MVKFNHLNPTFCFSFAVLKIHSDLLDVCFFPALSLRWVFLHHFHPVLFLLCHWGGGCPGKKAGFPPNSRKSFGKKWFKSQVRVYLCLCHIALAVGNTPNPPFFVLIYQQPPPTPFLILIPPLSTKLKKTLSYPHLTSHQNTKPLNVFFH